MEFTLKITFDATPALLNVLNAMFRVEAPASTPAQAPATPAAEKKEAKVNGKQAEKSSLKAVKKETPKQAEADPLDDILGGDGDATEGSGADSLDDLLGGQTSDENLGTVTLERIREFAGQFVNDGKKRPKLKALMDTFKIDMLTKLKEDQYEDFYEKLKKIA